jgi:hypothetical protein
LTRPCSSGGTISSRAGNGQVGVFVVRDNAAVGLHAERQRERVGVDAGLRREGAGRAQFEPEPGQAAAAWPPSGIERHILAHSLRAAFSRNGSARSRACKAAIWLAHRAVEQAA